MGKRVLIIGPQSSGKTELASFLLNQYYIKTGKQGVVFDEVKYDTMLDLLEGKEKDQEPTLVIYCAQHTVFNSLPNSLLSDFHSLHILF